MVDDVQDLSEEELAALFELANQVRAHSGTHLIVAGDKVLLRFALEGCEWTLLQAVLAGGRLLNWLLV